MMTGQEEIKAEVLRHNRQGGGGKGCVAGGKGRTSVVRKERSPFFSRPAGKGVESIEHRKEASTTPFNTPRRVHRSCSKRRGRKGILLGAAAREKGRKGGQQCQAAFAVRKEGKKCVPVVFIPEKESVD